MKKIGRTSPLLTVFVITLGLFVTTYLVKNSQDIRSRAADDAVACSGVLTVQISSDGINPSVSATVPAGVPTSYYVHVRSGGVLCSSSFDIYYQKCNLDGVTGCGSWSVKNSWPTVHSDKNGVARVDLNGPWPETMTRFKLRPANTSIAWSNEIKILTANSARSTTTTNLSDYFITRPGYTYIYRGKNYFTGVEGFTRLQMEEKTNICGLTIIPWRYTKTNNDSYWNPIISGTGAVGDRDLRWLIVDPAYNYSAVPSYNNVFWALGGKNYRRQNYADVNFGQLIKRNRYQSKLETLPAYYLLPKTAVLPYLFLGEGTTNHFLAPDTASFCSASSKIVTSEALHGSWKIRVQMDTLQINNTNYQYSGPALRVDYFEGGYPFLTAGVLRESWYYVKNVGLVKVVSRIFNGYAGANLTRAPNITSVASYLSNTMDNAETGNFQEMSLDSYFPNPTLQVAVSADGVNYSSSINIKRSNGYWLKITNNFPFTGYLEAYSTRIHKWKWLDNGLVKIPGDLLAGFQVGTSSRAKFRIWVPDDVVEGETRIGDTSIPWSNEVVITYTQ